MKAAWIIRRTRRATRRRALAVAALVGAFGLLVLLAGGARLSLNLADAFLPRLAANVHVIAYLRDEMAGPRADALAAIIRRIPGVDGVDVVGSAEALARLRGDVRAMGGASELLAGVEDGFLPRSLEIRLQPSATLGQRTIDLADRIRRIEGVAEVDAMEDGLARLRSILKVARVVGFALLGLALFAAVAVLTLPLSQRRDEAREEAEVLTLLGETERAIRLPSALTGALAALLGSLVGLAALRLLFTVISRAIADLTGGAGEGVVFLGSFEIVVGVAAAIAMGFWLGRAAMPLARVRHA